MIEIAGLTKQYPNGEGIFDISFSVRQGEVFGCLGPNGAGKTTTIRQLLGFMQPDAGTCSIKGLDCWRQADRVQEFLGYVPEESAFLEGLTGVQFLDFMHSMRGTADRSLRRALTERFQLDPGRRITRMSKGMRQKLTLIAAFMHDPEVYVLDEPTAGLDPLMQNTFIELIMQQRERGKTILMSSHRFEEVQRTCDRVGIIRRGRLVGVEDVHSLKASQRTAYIVTVGSEADVQTLRGADLEIDAVHQHRVEVTVSGDYEPFISALSECEVLGLDVRTQTLEQVFMKYYGRDREEEAS